MNFRWLSCGVWHDKGSSSSTMSSLIAQSLEWDEVFLWLDREENQNACRSWYVCGWQTLICYGRIKWVFGQTTALFNGNALSRKAKYIAIYFEKWLKREKLEKDKFTYYDHFNEIALCSAISTICQPHICNDTINANCKTDPRLERAAAGFFLGWLQRAEFFLSSELSSTQLKYSNVIRIS